MLSQLETNLKGAEAMRRNVLGKRAVLPILSIAAALLLWPAASFALSPTLGADCGLGASIVGADAAGKVMVGENVSTCTLTFSAPWPNPPACTAMNETSQGRGGGGPSPLGLWTTKTGLVLDGRSAGAIPLVDGDIISYLCVGY